MVEFYCTMIAILPPLACILPAYCRTTSSWPMHDALCQEYESSEYRSPEMKLLLGYQDIADVRSFLLFIP